MIVRALVSALSLLMLPVAWLEVETARMLSRALL